MAKLNFQQP